MTARNVLRDQEYPLVRLKHVCTDSGQYGLNVAADDYVDGGVRLIRTSDIQADGLTPNEDGIFITGPVEERFQLRRDDLVLSRAGTIGRAFLAPPEAEGMAFAGFLVRFRPRLGVVPRFVFYVTQGTEFQQAIQRDAVSNTISNFNAERYANLSIPLPPTTEQQLIADFLDRETAQIDAMVEAQRSLVGQLRERRFAAITRLITDGLNPSVSRRSSGLAASGDIPEHWSVIPLRYALSYQEGPGILAVDFHREGVPLLRVSSVRTRTATLEGCNYLDPAKVASTWRHFRVRKGDLLISASASMGTISEVATDDVMGAVPYTGIIRISPGRMLKEFVRWYFVSGPFLDQVESLKTGSTIQHFGPTHLAQMRVALPPADEQIQIASLLDSLTARIDATIDAATEAISYMEERRSALISAAVTGRLDSRRGKETVPEHVLESA